MDFVDFKFQASRVRIASGLPLTTDQIARRPFYNRNKNENGYWHQLWVDKNNCNCRYWKKTKPPLFQMYCLKSLVLIATFFLQRQDIQVNGFANNLVNSAIGCMTDLDTTEVIMNNNVKAAEDSAFPRMHLVVLVDDNHMESPYHYRSEDLTVVFVNPYTKDEFPDDLQFVIQLEGDGAEFVGGGSIGCDNNQRVAARLRDDGGQVQLLVHDTSAPFKLYAGWATGQSAVTLTPILLLEPHTDDGAPPVTDGKQAKKAESAIEEEADKRRSHKKGPRGASPSEKGSGKRKVEKALKEKAKKSAGRRVNKKYDNGTKGVKKPVWKEEAVVAGGDRSGPGSQKTKRIFKGEPDTDDETGKQQKPLKRMTEREQKEMVAEELERNFPDQRSLRYRYRRGISVDATSHYVACAFALVAMGAIYFLLGRRREKGRRDL